MLTFHLCRYGSGSGDIHISTNEAYGKVGGGQIEEGYELVDISHGDPPPPPPAKLEEMYEVPSSSVLPPSQPLPLPRTAADTEEKDTPVYDVIPGDM